MKVQPGSRLLDRLGAAMVTFVLCFLAGCAGPRLPHFGPLPPPGQQERAGYMTILGPVSGTGSATFTIGARPGLAVWIGCFGHGGKDDVRITWPVAVEAACHDGRAFAGGLIQPTRFRRGQKLVVRIAAPAAVRWEFRIDGAPWTTTPAPAATR